MRTRPTWGWLLLAGLLLAGNALGQAVHRMVSSLEELAATSVYSLAADSGNRALRASVLVQQYSTNNAPGWGASRWVWSANYAGDTNGVVVTTSPAGAWLPAEQLVTPLIYGATIEEDDTVDDTAAVQMAIDYNEAHDPPLPTYFPAGHYTISQITTVKSDLIGMSRVNRASRLKGVQFFHKSGATGSMVIIGDNQIQGIAQTATIQNISSVGKSETNLKDPKTITAVTDRLTFEVDPGDVPTYSPSTRAPYYGIAGLFSDENRYIGSVMVKTVDTMTGVITVEPGTDNYATSDASAELLDVGFKVCFPQVVTVTNFQGNVYTGFSSAAGGYNAIEIRTAKGVNIRDCSFSRWYVAVAQYADNGPQFEGYNEFTYPRLASYLNAFAIYGSDTKVDGTIMVIGNYATDIENAEIAESYTWDNEAFRSTTIGWHGIIGGTAANVEIGSCVYGLVLENANGSHFGRVLVEGPIREAVWSWTGNSSFNAAGPAFIGNLQIKTSPHFTEPTVRATNATPLIRLDGNYSRLAIGNVSVYKHKNASPSDGWEWDSLYDINSGTSNTLAIGSFMDHDGLVVTEYPAGTQRAINAHAGEQRFMSYDFVQPTLTFARAGVSTYGWFHSSTLVLREDTDGDGVYEYPIIGFDGTTTTREMRFGAQDGESSNSRNDVIRGTKYTGTDVAANNVIIVGQLGTGAGAAGNIVFQTGDVGSSGTTQHSASTAVTIRANDTLTLATIAGFPSTGLANGSVHYDTAKGAVALRAANATQNRHLLSAIDGGALSYTGGTNVSVTVPDLGQYVHTLSGTADIFLSFSANNALSSGVLRITPTATRSLSFGSNIKLIAAQTDPISLDSTEAWLLAWWQDGTTTFVNVAEYLAP